ncbi:MAG: acetate kinase [Pseudonocardiaceae bacterium]|nr:acetate kinase [Pseudonocardiaceae bacterium]
MPVTGTVLAVNPGSSSLKAHLVDLAGETVLDSVSTEHQPTEDETNAALDELHRRGGEPAAVGYRLVHGGPDVRQPTPVDDRVVERVRRAESLAPMHMPRALSLLDTVRGRLPETPHVVCPDTAFHIGLPDAVSTYPLPHEWRDRWDLRRYGFHGLSYAWALRRAAGLLGRERDDTQVVLAHLGGGCSVCAVRDGTSVDTSMGLTPLEGVPMTTRSGSVDPGMLVWLLRHTELGVDELADGLERHSGLLGLSGERSADTRDLVRASRDGDGPAELAMRVFGRLIAREVAAVASGLDRIDALVFTGEIGWDQPEVREDVCANLGILGISGGLRGNRDQDGPVSDPRARVPVLVVRPREELQIAADTASAISLVTNTPHRETRQPLGER